MKISTLSVATMAALTFGGVAIMYHTNSVSADSVSLNSVLITASVNQEFSDLKDTDLVMPMDQGGWLYTPGQDPSTVDNSCSG